MNIFELLFANMIQAGAVISIVVCGVIGYWVAKPQWQVRILTGVSLLIVLSVVMQRLGIMIPLFGFPSFRIDFLHIPLILIGALFGPFFAVVAGIVADVVGLIITPTDFPFFGFMLNKVLMGFIPAILIIVIKKIPLRVGVRVAHVLLLSLTLVSFFYLWTSASITIRGEHIFISPQTRLLVTAVVLSFMLVLHGLLMNKTVSKVRVFALLAALLVELSVSLTLTPIWLVTMYDIPVFLSFIVRVVEAIFMIPISALLLEGLIKAISKATKQIYLD